MKEKKPPFGRMLLACIVLAQLPPQVSSSSFGMFGSLVSSVGLPSVGSGTGNEEPPEGRSGDEDKSVEFEAMCLVSREPDLSSPPELRFYSSQSHSADTLGCSADATKFTLSDSPDDSDATTYDEDIRSKLLETGLYSAGNGTYFLIHGFMASWDSSSWMCRLKDTILNGSSANVFIVDWSGGSKPMLPGDYGQAVANTKLVAELLAPFVRSLTGASGAASVHFIGHSLGAQISGFVGYLMEGQLGRITALDPAGPCFSAGSASGRSQTEEASMEGYLRASDTGRRRLSASSAKLVVALHTDSSLFGLRENCAHYDVYYNGGAQQPGCQLLGGATDLPSDLLSGQLPTVMPDITCSHSYAHDLIETFDYDSDKCQMVAYECRSYEAFVAGECGLCSSSSDSRCIYIGLHKQAENPEPTSTSGNHSTAQGGARIAYNPDPKFNGEDNQNSNFLTNLVPGPFSAPSSPAAAAADQSSQTQLVSSVRHFIKSGTSPMHCLHHYQVLVAIGRAGRRKPRRKYYLSIPLGDNRRRLVQVSHLIGRKSADDIQNDELLAKPTSDHLDYFSALITFRPECEDSSQDNDRDDDDDRSLCGFLSAGSGFQLRASKEAHLSSVQWVAINFMSGAKVEARRQHSIMLQPAGAPQPFEGSDDNRNVMSPMFGNFDQMLDPVVGSIGASQPDMQYYIKLASV